MKKRSIVLLSIAVSALVLVAVAAALHGHHLIHHLAPALLGRG